MLSPFFRLPAPLPPVADFEEVMPLRPLIGLGSHSGSGGFPGLSRQMVGGGDPRDAWLSARAAGIYRFRFSPRCLPRNFKSIKQSCIPSVVLLTVYFSGFFNAVRPLNLSTA
jgi:hypothetical protein